MLKNIFWCPWVGVFYRPLFLNIHWIQIKWEFTFLSFWFTFPFCCKSQVKLLLKIIRQRAEEKTYLLCLCLRVNYIFVGCLCFFYIFIFNLVSVFASQTDLTYSSENKWFKMLLQFVESWFSIHHLCRKYEQFYKLETR